MRQRELKFTTTFLFCVGFFLALGLFFFSKINPQPVFAQMTKCNYTDNPSHPCNGHEPGWSTCDGSGRWGCDQACNKVNLDADWCEGTAKKSCKNGTISSSPNDPFCGGQMPGDACAGRTGNICEDQSNGNGLVTVLNCTGQTQNYTCQTNHEAFENQGQCDGAKVTNNFSGYTGMSVGNGQRGSCSASPQGACNIAQADIRLNNNSICWDTSKDCTNCSRPTPTPTPVPVECTALEAYRLVNGYPSAALSPTELTSLKQGETIRFRVSFSGAAENAGIKIMKGNSEVLNITAGGNVVNAWNYDYTIPTNVVGGFEIWGFIKENGVWQ